MWQKLFISPSFLPKLFTLKKSKLPPCPMNSNGRPLEYIVSSATVIIYLAIRFFLGQRSTVRRIIQNLFFFATWPANCWADMIFDPLLNFEHCHPGDSCLSYNINNETVFGNLMLLPRPPQQTF